MNSRIERSRVREVMGRVIEIRRKVHAHPELGYEEHETSKLVSEVLEPLGLEVRTGVAGTGVVGVLHGRDTGHTVALRADMDALPITEDTGLAFSSTVPGKMHACGHDGHVAMLLGTAMVLSGLRDLIHGSVKFIFQPSEERTGGALPMIERGVLEDPDVDAIFAAHLWPDVPFGCVGVHEGPAMAALDEIHIEIYGKGGHVATPHRSIDAVLGAASFILELQSIVSREIDPTEPAVVSIGQVCGGTAYNAIADKVMLGGTVRVVNPDLRQVMEKKISDRLRGLQESYGIQHSFEYRFGYPPVVNDHEMARFVREVAGELLGRDKAFQIARPVMAGEDFAYYLERVPGAIFLLGIGDSSVGNHPLHHPKFMFNEDVLEVGVWVLSQIAVSYLERFKSPRRDHDRIARP